MQKINVTNMILPERRRHNAVYRREAEELTHAYEGIAMTSRIEFSCGTIVPGCEFVIHGETKAEVLAKLCGA